MNNPFKSIPESRILSESEDFLIIKDIFPVSPGHILIISKREVTDFFALTDSERNQLNKSILIAKSLIELEYKPNGYNIGMNCGEAAGQTVFHFHCHVIPRYIGDMENPRGGVRHCVEGKGNY
ncbi:MAG: HIT family protein [Fluviicola sp.]|jgi:diadenosine tetraphosphate (Ap4A) HIT family hydrolase|nr:HIT family protein [Fluviicola sp.]